MTETIEGAKKSRKRTETVKGVKKPRKMTGTMEGSTSEAIPTSSSPRKDVQTPQVLVSVRVGCQQAMCSLSVQRNNLSLAMGGSQQQESRVPRPGFQELNGLLLNAENAMSDAIKSTWKVKAEEIDDKQAKNTMRKLMVVSKQASEATKKMSTLLNDIKGMDPICADALIHYLMEKNK